MVSSSQSSIHPDLKKTVDKHCANEWRQPVALHTELAFNVFQRVFQDSGLNHFILDVGCGTGQSTMQLAQQFPEKLVVGIDQSEQRLGRGILTAEQKAQLQNNYVLMGNCLLLRAEAADFWRLLSTAGLKPKKMYIFYPNPWPKSGHLLRRWHGHPVFPTLMSLNSPIELRSNWKIYLQEFAVAAAMLTDTRPVVQMLGFGEATGVYCSPFEKKYFESEHPLWRLQIQGD